MTYKTAWTYLSPGTPYSYFYSVLPLRCPHHPTTYTPFLTTLLLGLGFHSRPTRTLHHTNLLRFQVSKRR